MVGVGVTGGGFMTASLGFKGSTSSTFKEKSLGKLSMRLGDKASASNASD